MVLVGTPFTLDWRSSIKRVAPWSVVTTLCNRVPFRFQDWEMAYIRSITSSSNRRGTYGEIVRHMTRILYEDVDYENPFARYFVK
jgi:hypothetical protein